MAATAVPFPTLTKILPASGQRNSDARFDVSEVLYCAVVFEELVDDFRTFRYGYYASVRRVSTSSDSCPVRTRSSG